MDLQTILIVKTTIQKHINRMIVCFVHFYHVHSFFGVRSSLSGSHNCIFGARLAQRPRQPPSSSNGSAGVKRNFWLHTMYACTE